MSLRPALERIYGDVHFVDVDRISSNETLGQPAAKPVRGPHPTKEKRTS